MVKHSFVFACSVCQLGCQEYEQTSSGSDGSYSVLNGARVCDLKTT